MAIITDMVTYCIGSARQKRTYFEEASGVVTLDNVEVLFCASENGRNYFAFGDVPFKTFTVDDYLKYRRALCVGNVSPNIDEFLKKQKISGNKKLGRISPVQMRVVTYLEKTAGVTQKTVVINLDGTKYTRKLNAQLKSFLSAIGDAYVCVTDRRFVEKADKGYKTLEFGKHKDGGKATFVAAKILARKVGAKRIAITD